jgi:predicted RNase H-like nuclease
VFFGPRASHSVMRLFCPGWWDGLRAVAIDIPIGLLDASRACDKAARQRLGWPRRNSVFSPPCRAALAGVDYAEMCNINTRIVGARLTKQSCAIVPKIKEVDDAITPAHQSWVFEVHPEVCFWHFAGEKAMEHKKKSRAGREERLQVLTRYLPGIAEHLASRPNGVASDDLLDAAVAALAAQRWMCGEATPVGEPQYDAKGLRVEIVF